MPSRSFIIFCSQCNGYILRYRKEGSGTLIRIYVKQILEPDIFKQFKKKKRSKIKPVGFIVGSENIYLTTDHGRLIIIDILK